MMHTMTLIESHEGTEDWRCPECGREFLIEWDPWKKTVIVEGDASIAHRGGKLEIEIDAN